mmetsp:Transcript_19751/g.54369  ORF Transcript_19751/g.54369 Transcript_19751/m.54369 type:complete len:230 (+) Transcript_19751:787-1476(+)
MASPSSQSGHCSSQRARRALGGIGLIRRSVMPLLYGLAWSDQRRCSRRCAPRAPPGGRWHSSAWAQSSPATHRFGAGKAEQMMHPATPMASQGANCAGQRGLVLSTHSMQTTPTRAHSWSSRSAGSKIRWERSSCPRTRCARNSYLRWKSLRQVFRFSSPMGARTVSTRRWRSEFPLLCARGAATRSRTVGKRRRLAWASRWTALILTAARKLRQWPITALTFVARCSV